MRRTRALKCCDCSLSKCNGNFSKIEMEMLSEVSEIMKKVYAMEGNVS